MVKKILVIRLSAMGDVAMTIPTIASLASQYPNVEITMLSREFFRPLFANLPSNVKFYGIDVKGKHKGIFGLTKLFFNELLPMKFNAVADFHDVLRTQYLRRLFLLSGAKVVHINKGRKEKKAVISGKHSAQLRPMVQRYADVVQRLGLPITFNFVSIFGNTPASLEGIDIVSSPKAEDEKWIGIAPFAAHLGKLYPIDHMERVIDLINAQMPACKIFCFGAGSKEKEVLHGWADSKHNVFSVAGRYSLSDELRLISNLDVMVSMDSANMHLASLVNVPVVSIWGATAPCIGFLGYRQSESNVVQRTDLACRPCSVFGNKPCRLAQNEFPCMQIDSQLVYNAIVKLLP